jgi:hypothetical protein
MDTTFPDPAAHQPRPTLSEDQRERSLRHRESPERRRFMELLAGHRRGRLFVEDPTGHRLMFGAPLSLPLMPFALGLAPEARMLVRDEAFFDLFLARPGEGLADGFRDGLWESASPEAVVAFLLQKTGGRGPLPRKGLLPRLRQALLGAAGEGGSAATPPQPAQTAPELPPPATPDGAAPTPTDLTELWDSLPLRRGDQVLVLHPETATEGGERARRLGCRVVLLARTAEQAAHLRRPPEGNPAPGVLEILAPGELKDDRRFDRILACEPFITAGGTSPDTLAQLLARHLKPTGLAALQILVETRCRETLDLDSNVFLSRHAPGLGKPLPASEILGPLGETGLLQVHSWTDVSKKASQTTAARLATLRSRNGEWDSKDRHEPQVRAVEMCLCLRQASLALREIQACRILLSGPQNTALP